MVVESVYVTILGKAIAGLSAAGSISRDMPANPRPRLWKDMDTRCAGSIFKAKEYQNSMGVGLSFLRTTIRAIAQSSS